MATMMVRRLGFPLIVGVICSICLWAPLSAVAESVHVKYRGLVDLAPFECEWVSRSSLVKRPNLQWLAHRQACRPALDAVAPWLSVLPSRVRMLESRSGVVVRSRSVGVLLLLMVET
jgi:hypothetical protein